MICGFILCFILENYLFLDTWNSVLIYFFGRPVSMVKGVYYEFAEAISRSLSLKSTSHLLR